MIILGNKQAFNENHVVRLIVRQGPEIYMELIFINYNLMLEIRNEKMADELYQIIMYGSPMHKSLLDYLPGKDFGWK